MRNVLVVEDGRIVGVLYQINGQRRHFGNHDAPQRIRDARVCMRENKLDYIRLQLQQLDLGKALVWHDEIVGVVCTVCVPQ
jgi:hypothetical protein